MLMALIHAGPQGEPAPMTPPLIHENFLLQNDVARALYHEHAAPLPIIDYHCHLDPRLIAEDHRFRNMTEIWLGGDHYKWRAMRTDGVPERLITGNAGDWEKFEAWAATCPHLLRNPLYHWTHLELNRPFGINDRLLGPATARAIWEECNALLATPEFSARGLLRQMNVRALCTTDDPADDLRWHAQLAADENFEIRVLPTFRADKALAVADGAAFNAWVDRLAVRANVVVRDWASLLQALRARHAAFHALGCRLSDHGLETIPAADYTDAEIARIFNKLRNGAALSAEETAKFQAAVLYELALMDHAAGWVQQFHLGALRNNNARLLKQLGPDTGFDSIGDFELARPLAKFLNRLDATDQLAKTILYNLNPRDNELLATMIGNFQDGSVPGKLQFGGAWWFLDQREGMLRQLDALSNMGLLARFVGMLTDSRSFLSYTRHEYFRRILCNLLGEEVAAGLLPHEPAMLGELVRNVCYENARRFFDFGLPEG
jgi:glucuronate isomerase